MISLEQLQRIMQHCPADKAQLYLPYLNKAMFIAKIDTVTRAAAFLAQLAVESGDLKYMEEIADGSAYEGRKDLGNIQPGDGKRYKGRGPIQLTGRSNYAKVGKEIGLPLEDHPELVANPEVGFRVAAQYWIDHNLNAIADRLDFYALTQKINGGFRMYQLRSAYYVHALGVLGLSANLFSGAL